MHVEVWFTTTYDKHKAKGNLTPEANVEHFIPLLEWMLCLFNANFGC